MGQEQLPTHYCVHCAARWVNHADGTWSVLTDCGPCCNNVPMDEAPLAKMLPNGTVDGDDYNRVKEALDRKERQQHVDAYRGILCAICDEPFERHSSDWHCPKRVAPRFKFPAENQRAGTPPVGEIGALVERLRRVKGTRWATPFNHGSTPSPLAQECIDALEAFAAHQEELLSEAEFLCERLREVENELQDDYTGSQFCGHVSPSLARLESILSRARGDKPEVGL